jgi:hypothetical protein
MTIGAHLSLKYSDVAFVDVFCFYKTWKLLVICNKKYYFINTFRLARFVVNNALPRVEFVRTLSEEFNITPGENRKTIKL